MNKKKKKEFEPGSKVTIHHKVEEKCSRKQCLVLEHKVKDTLQPTKYEYLSSVRTEMETITKKLDISNDQLFEALMFGLLQSAPSLIGGSESVINALLFQINVRKTNG